MAQYRTFYATQAIGFAQHNVTTSGGDPSGFITAHGVQSVGLNTTFNLDPVYELGQLELYENIEGIPDIEITAQKVLDGYPLLYHLATPGAVSPTLVGRSNERSYCALNIYPDTNDNASGIPLQAVGMSGVYVSAMTYTFNVEGNSTEDLTLVGNNKQWFASGLTHFMPDFDGTDEPLSLAASGGVCRREDILMGSGSFMNADGSITGASGSIWPTLIPGIDASGWNLPQVDEDAYSAHIQTVTISADLGRDTLLEQGRRGPYHRYVTFPIEVTCAIELISTEGDAVDALADPPGGTNLVNEKIFIETREGTRVNLGTRNKLASITYGGGDTGGGNATTTYNFSNYNHLTVQHVSDPASL